MHPSLLSALSVFSVARCAGNNTHTHKRTHSRTRNKHTHTHTHTTNNNACSWLLAGGELRTIEQVFKCSIGVGCLVDVIVDVTADVTVDVTAEAKEAHGPSLPRVLRRSWGRYRRMKGFYSIKK
eukprot:Tamp_28381.p1 GENE.Tamp_28381~~Tamp_28381.p1  ORF type:complete len:124 (+),score=8.02 Tamp_28381:429-800(+)